MTTEKRGGWEERVPSVSRPSSPRCAWETLILTPRPSHSVKGAMKWQLLWPLPPDVP